VPFSAITLASATVLAMLSLRLRPHAKRNGAVGAVIVAAILNLQETTGTITKRISMEVFLDLIGGLNMNFSLFLFDQAT